jgi:hypothetical protein
MTRSILVTHFSLSLPLLKTEHLKGLHKPSLLVALKGLQRL